MTGVLLGLHAENGSVVLRISDDGRGIEPRAAHDAGGLGGMRERGMLTGGRLGSRQLRPRGTEIVLKVPVER